ncbi:helix-turn-helix domain-containing protein [Frigoribacterium sp. VKM Ac-2530]|jgi:transcriptional regulator with XRE-family HTH domain|uniref:helix-turn-helix domain-containing protein n=1 Tax=Frigoribacterium sp. VKM Ac-2530 TaxID=2783822 RepID=UPI00188AD5D7|nr:helix-turn-helix transcriptional regulator [Frigoribacterium sp. VKM Ac-2530]MBF4578502.1 helix-turn-helix domain-containing protein [Frigoribacterium sp. VKM Ac-2530]
MMDQPFPDSPVRSTDEWEARIGSQVRASRLDAGLDQISLARRADLSTSTLQSLENGRGSTLSTLVRVLRALGAEDALDALAPASAVSPIDVLRSADPAPRRRVYRPRAPRGSSGS